MRIEQPPKNGTLADFERWLEKLYQYVRPLVQLAGDADAAIGSGASYVGITALSASRTLTLPPTTEMADGHEILVQDEIGLAGTYSIVIESAGSDTVNGASSVSIASNFGRRLIIKRGNGTWFSA